MKSILYFIILSSFYFTQCSGCKDYCGSGELEFNLSVQAFGIKDTLQIGDTIRLNLEIPDRLPERNTQILYDFINYNFKLVTYMVKIDSLPATANSKESFDWITLQGDSKYFNDVFLVAPNYTGNAYHYEVLIIAKQKGLFVFGMNSDFSRLSPLEKLEGPCSNRSVAAYLKLQDDTNVNFEFLKQSPDIIQANIDRQRFNEFAGFCFYVR